MIRKIGSAFPLEHTRRVRVQVCVCVYLCVCVCVCVCVLFIWSVKCVREHNELDFQAWLVCCDASRCACMFLDFAHGFFVCLWFYGRKQLINSSVPSDHISRVIFHPFSC